MPLRLEHAACPSDWRSRSGQTLYPTPVPSPAFLVFLATDSGKCVEVFLGLTETLIYIWPYRIRLDVPPD